jgi:hypothetical protein
MLRKVIVIDGKAPPVAPPRDRIKGGKEPPKAPPKLPPPAPQKKK